MLRLYRQSFAVNIRVTDRQPRQGNPKMNDIRFLMQAYYEQLYNFLESNRKSLTAQVDPMLQRELDQRDFGGLTPDQIIAYHEACQAFIIERVRNV
jgi:hypothetical protein